jgi:hypothetical protein
MSKEALNLAARRLQAQTDYTMKLAECAGPSEWLVCHGEFVRSSFAGCFEDVRRILDALRSFSFASTSK